MPASSSHPIVVLRSPTGFVLRDPVLCSLIGVDSVPLPFTTDADPAHVVAHLRRLNPTRAVLLSEVALDEPNGGRPASRLPLA